MTRMQALVPGVGWGSGGGWVGRWLRQRLWYSWQPVHSRIPMERLMVPAQSRLPDLRVPGLLILHAGSSACKASWSLRADSLGLGFGCHAEESQGFEEMFLDSTFISIAH